MADSSGVYYSLVRAQALRGMEQTEDYTLADTETTKHLTYEDLTEMVTPTSTVQQDIPEKTRGLFKSFGRLLYEQRAKWPNYIGILLSSMAVAAGTPIQAWLFAKALGVFLLQGDELKTESQFWGLMWFALAGGVALGYVSEGWVGLRMQYYVSAVYKSQYLNDMLYQKLAFFDSEENSHGSLSSRVSSDAKQLEELLGVNLALLLSAVFNVTGCVIISLVFGWKLGLIAMSVALPVMIAAGCWKFKHEVHFDKMNSAVFMESSQFATEAIEAMRTVSSLTMEDSITSRYRELLDSHVNAANRKAQWTSAIFGFADSVGLGCQALLFWYGGSLLASGEYTMEAFFVCFMAVIQGAEAGSQGFGLAPSAAQVTASANRILDVQRSVHPDHLSGGSPEGGINDVHGGVKIELRDVSFKYPTRDVSVFDSLSITIEKGQYVAFVGASGSGKSTVISLLERFYDLEPGNGAILCNSQDIKHTNVYEYRQALSLVSQEPAMFRGSIRDNILFGVADPDSVTDEQIYQVCRDAFIHEFIISLPEGYNTDVGHKGVSMSGGQKQRIAIARALIRDPKLLLLDEATSALDSESEKVVAAAIDKARDGRTVISVAHRLSTVQNADVIFVFDNGRVVEKGSHTELINRQGIYWEMVSLLLLLNSFH
jgi:ABC-type multidrug transport system fused ATPase/permease subunit